MKGVGKKGNGWGRGINGLWQREVGDVSPYTFKLRVGASEDLVLQLGLYRKLDKHRGCVNTLSFSSDGDILISGSDDRMVMLWDWERGDVKLSFHSGHTNNVFQAKMMPYTDNRTIITCAADGEVRCARINEGGRIETTLLARHEGRAHKMAVEPGSPHIFYSCGEDGLVQRFDLRMQSALPLFVCKQLDDTYTPIVQLNTIVMDPWNPNLFAVGGSDEYARMYDIRKYKWTGLSDVCHPVDYFCPPHLIGDDHVGITGLAFSDHSELLASYNDELIYLFSKNQGLGPSPIGKPTKTGDGLGSSSESSCDMSTGTDNKPAPQAYSGHQNCNTVKGVNFFGPNCEYVVSGSDCGRIFIWRKKDGELLRAMEGDKHIVNCIEPHPHSTMIASSGLENDIKLWIPNAVERAPPVNLDEVLMPDRIAWFALDDYDYDYIDDDDDGGGDDSFDDTDDFDDDFDFSDDNDANNDDDDDDDDAMMVLI